MTYIAPSGFEERTGGNFYWEDMDNGSATRMYLASNTGDLWVNGSVSGASIIDRSDWCDNLTGKEAINILNRISGKSDGTIDKDTMPSCAVNEIPIYNKKDEIIGTEKGRNIGVYTSYLTIVNQEQQKEIDLLKSELCKKDLTYSWC